MHIHWDRRTTWSCSCWKSGSTGTRYCVGELPVDSGLGEWCIDKRFELCEDDVWINYEALDTCVSKKSEALDAYYESEVLDEYEFNDSVVRENWKSMSLI